MVPPHTVRLEFNSAFDMLDFVQVISDHVCKEAGLDEDQLHWVSVAVRESVVNAIKHGNKNDPNKRVIIEFSPVPASAGDELVIRIEDQGEGFVPEEVADPLAPENILKSSGRGIFLIRNFMDETVLKKVPGGMEIRMVKKLQKSGRVTDPQFLATAIEAVVRAGNLQIAKFGKNVRVEKKGAIDLVTEVDLEVERMFRALIAQRFPDHDVLAEEIDVASRGARHRWVFDPLDGTTNFAHGVPIFCASLALEIDGRAEVAAVYDPNRQELFTAEAGVGSWLNGERLSVSSNATLLESMLVTGFPYNVHEKADEFVKTFAQVLGTARAIRRLGSAAIDICWIAAGRMDGFWEASLKPWDTRAAALILEEAGGRVSRMDGSPWNAYEPDIVASNGVIHEEILKVLRA